MGTVAIASRPASARTVPANRAAEMSRAWDEMAAAALDFTSDRYRSASARFWALNGEK